MTLLKAACLWLLAVGLSGWMLWCLLRGRPTAARRRSTLRARALQVAALLLVMLGVRVDRGAAQPPSGSTTPSPNPVGFPAALRSGAIERYAGLHVQGGSFARLGGLLSRMDEPAWARRPQRDRERDVALAVATAERLGIPDLSPRLADAIRHAAGARPVPIPELTALLAAAEASPAYEQWLAAWILRHADDPTAAAPMRAAFLARVERYLRVAEALERAAAQVGPVVFVPWRKMSSPPPGYRSARAPAGLGAAAEALYPGLTLDSWTREGAIELVVAAGSADGQLWRRGTVTRPGPAAAVRLGRLDVLAAPDGDVLLDHRELGRITVPRGAVLTARGLPALLDATQRARIGSWITRARRGDARALASLESSLPAAHAMLREEIATRPEASGTGRLRTLLALFDE